MRQAEACAGVFNYYFGLTGHQVEVLFDLLLHGPAKAKAMLWQRFGRCLVVWLIASGILAAGSSVLFWPGSYNQRYAIALVAVREHVAASMGRSTLFTAWSAACSGRSTAPRVGTATG